MTAAGYVRERAGAPTPRVRDLAAAIGIDSSIVTRYTTVDMQTVSLATIERMAEVCGVSPAWLAWGKGPMRASSPSAPEAPTAESVGIGAAMLDGATVADVEAARAEPDWSDGSVRTWREVRAEVLLQAARRAIAADAPDSRPSAMISVPTGRRPSTRPRR